MHLALLAFLNHALSPKLCTIAFGTTADLQFVTDLSVLLCLVHRSLHPYAEPIVQGLVQRQLVLDLFPNKSRDTVRGQ